MASQALLVQCPLKGVNRAFNREKQPDGTLYDSLNLLPLDRYGRLRIGSRPGVGTLATLTNLDPVRMLHIASTTGDPAIVQNGFHRSPSAEQALDFEAGAIAHVDSEANSFFTIRHANSNTEFPLRSTSNNGFARLKTVGGQSGLRAYHAAPITISDYTFAWGVTPVLGTSATWLAASNAVWAEAIVRLADLTATVDARPAFAITLAIPTADIASNAGSTITQGITVTFEVDEDNVVGGQILARFAGADDTTIEVQAVGDPITITDDQDYKLIVVAYGRSLYIYVDDFAQQYLLSQTTLPTSLSVANIIDTRAAVGVTNTLNAAVDQPDTIKTFKVYQANFAQGGVSRTLLKLVGTAGDGTYVGDPTNMVLANASNTYPINEDSLFIAAATLYGFTYIVDGTSIRKLDHSDNTMKAFTESAGTAPTGCNIAATWRGRLVLAGSDTDPQNFFASRAGNPLDWDSGQTDSAASFDGNAASAGKIGQPIHALITMSDDLLILGLEQSIYVVRGDPMDNGSIDLVSDAVGISSSTSWAKGPDGSIYFVGPRGFFRIDPQATAVQELSQNTYPQYFQQINRARNFISMIYDANLYGVWVFVTPTDGLTAGTHIFYDLRNGGFWPQRFTNQVAAAPMHAVYWDGYDTDLRYPVLGGNAGVLYGMNLTNRSDNGQALDSFAVLGPFHPSNGDAILTGMQISQGELSHADQSSPARWQMSVTVRSGKSAYDVTEGTPTNKYLVGIGRDRRPKMLRQRIRGEWYSCMISNGAAGNYFSFESAVMEFQSLGRNRRQG